MHHIVLCWTQQVQSGSVRLSVPGILLRGYVVINIEVADATIGRVWFKPRGVAVEGCQNLVTGGIRGQVREHSGHQVQLARKVQYNLDFFFGILFDFFAFDARFVDRAGVNFGVAVGGGGGGLAPSSTLGNIRVNKREKTGIDSPLAQQLVPLPEELGNSEVACTQKLSQGCLVDVFDGNGLLTADQVLGPMVNKFGFGGHDHRLGGVGCILGFRGHGGGATQEIYEGGGALGVFMDARAPKARHAIGWGIVVFFFFFSPLPITTMSTYTGFGNGFDSGSMGDLGFQAPDGHNQWQFNSIGNAPGARQSAFGSQAVQNSDIILGIVAGASKAMLERNAFYVGLKTMASNQATEIEALKGTIEQKTEEIISRDREIDILKARCETLEALIDRFARDHHSLKGAGSDEGQIAFLTDLGPMLAPGKRNENPEVTIWMKREFALAAAKAKAQKGESSGDPSDTNKTKGKAGRPSKKDQEEVGHKYIYLQCHDGTLISVEMLGNMSVKARSIWDFLLKKGMATPTFCKLPWDASDLYTCAMLTDPEFDFLLLCDDATWKLQEWSIQNYPGWAGNQGLRPKNTNENAGRIADALDDPALIRMKSSDGMDNSNNSIQPDNGSESNNYRIEETTPGTEDTGVPQLEDDPKETLGPSTQLVHSVLAILGDTNTRSKPQGPIVPGEHPDPSTLSSSVRPTSLTYLSSLSAPTHTGVTTTNTTIAPAPVSSAPVQTSEDATTATRTHAAPSGTLGEASAAATTETLPNSGDPSRPTGTTPPGGSDRATTANGAIPPQCRIKLIVRPQAPTTVAEVNQDAIAPPVPSEPAQTPMADAPIPNLRLERAMANAERKRKGKGRTAAATSKKQKTATTLAEPTGTITIKNICMRQWNEQQPGGQGLATDFDAYFKGLSDADKERFKTEMRVAQATARKAKTATKKPNEAPSVN
ncbi:hypothetical protein H4582DRAFT_2058306 [Lactarius indigo]|nr:hypothetical protein H4582DRAFT_2058306 [Lactarius indigo]